MLRIAPQDEVSVYAIPLMPQGAAEGGVSKDGAAPPWTSLAGLPRNPHEVGLEHALLQRMGLDDAVRVEVGLVADLD